MLAENTEAKEEFAGICGAGLTASHGAMLHGVTQTQTLPSLRSSPGAPGRAGAWDVLGVLVAVAISQWDLKYCNA